MDTNGILIQRIFQAPRALVFAAFTQPQHLRRWWFPHGCSAPHVSVDLRVGGKFHFCMALPGGLMVWALGVFREIKAPERIVYLNSFADQNGHPVPPAFYGFSAGHPAESLVTLEFKESGGHTEVTLRHGFPESAPEFSDARKGWTEMFAQLARLLEALLLEAEIAEAG